MIRTRVLVVDDSLTLRHHLVEVLNADPCLEVIGEAENGRVAIELCESLRPDVITLDMMMPVMSGLAVTEYVMAHFPTPILIVSASTNRGELYKTYDALAAGALDVIEKNARDEGHDTWERGLITAVKVAARVKVITHIRGKIGQLGRIPANPLTTSLLHEASSNSGQGSVIAIGGSTGSPAAIVEILQGLPADFRIPILLVIHISVRFGAAFAEWLDGQTSLRVRYAQDGELLPALGNPGVVMAPPGSHLIVQQGRLRLTSGYERNSCIPSIDVLFESLAQEMGDETTACLLTGMGKDGAAGLLALRRAGAMTMVQDEATSVVFGMPKEAIQIGAARRVLAVSQIAPALNMVAREAELERKR